MSFILAIDGPAGAGKSTVAKQVALQLRFTRVDTGALYRTVALLAQRRGLAQEADIEDALESVRIDLDEDRVLLDGEDVSAAIRTPEISTRSSQVSALPRVRAALLPVQRNAALRQPKGAVLEGRDIGTVVFPDATLKIFLTASDEARAQRRTRELEVRGTPQPFDEVLADIRARDARDATRDVAPLRPAGDAVLLDTTQLGLDAVVRTILDLVHSRNDSLANASATET